MPRHPFLFAALLAQAAFAACEPPRGISPDNTTITQALPRIAWQPAEGATGYRIRLQSRVPNGRVLASYDTRVAAPVFAPPQRLTDYQAKVTVRVQALCGAEESDEATAAFVIDTSPLCVLREMSASSADGKVRVKWAPVGGAARYEVRLLGVDGRLLGYAEARGSEAELLLPSSAMVSVQPICAAGRGEAVYRAVAAD